MNCRDYHEQAPEYLAGLLDGVALRDFEAHVRECPALGAEVDEMRQFWKALDQLPQPTPSAALRTGFYRKLAALDRPRAATPSRWLPAWGNGALAWAAAAALFVAGVTVGDWRGSQRNGASTEVAQLRSEVQTMRQMVAIALLDRTQPSANSRLEGVSWSRRVDSDDREVRSALLSTLNRDPNVNVRLSAVDALQKFTNDRAVRAALQDAIATQDSPLVQIALIDTLVQARDGEAALGLMKIAAGQQYDAAVRKRAAWGAQRLQAQ